jgi:hypothetical protein
MPCPQSSLIRALIQAKTERQGQGQFHSGAEDGGVVAAIWQDNPRSNLLTDLSPKQFGVAKN